MSEDAKRKGFRYLLLRTKRGSIFFGKFIAAFIIIVPIIVLSVLAIAFYIYLKINFYSWGEVLSWSLWAIVVFTISSIPSIAFCLGISALINSSFGSLAASVSALGLLPIITRILKDNVSFMAFLQYLVPLKATYFLYNPQWWVVILATLGCLAYAALFSGGSYFYFKRKSL
jgi:ABC-type transport system involved in multi-copper enzyme maturation permease subunit